MTSTMYRALDDVAEERVRQDAKWGEVQHLLDGTGPLFMLGGAYADELLIEARENTDGEYATFADVLLEEVFEAMAEDGDLELRAELIQVAAVAVKWVEHIDRRNA